MADQRYLVTARKYRPALFKDVVAQEHVTDTLKNALRLDRLAHAYLFSGPRGVGKTTTARILAKAINCETPREEREDEAEPCCACDSCLAFEDGRSLNVFEMDAASNNKVDDIRELRETVRIPPQGATKKVYILDEVHMLSTQAFNALLKTLEEPPPHALFIFATTEPHKVLATILSRCQRFDFRRIPVPEIVERLREICDEEGIEADEESLMLLARKGDGALRDALSAFDQAISLCGTTLEYGDLTQALGVVDQDLFFRLTDHVAKQDTAGVLQLVHHVVRSGYDLQEFLVGLAEHLRNLLVARSLDGSALEEVATSTQERYAAEAERFGEADLLRLLSLAGDAEEDVKASSQPRLKLEMTLLKMAKMRRSADLQAVLQKIERLEQMVEDGTLPERLPAMDAASGASGEAAEATTEPSGTTAEPDSSYDTSSADAPRSEEESSPDAADPEPAPGARSAESGLPTEPAPSAVPDDDAAQSDAAEPVSAAAADLATPEVFEEDAPGDSESVDDAAPGRADTESDDIEPAGGGAKADDHSASDDGDASDDDPPPSEPEPSTPSAPGDESAEVGYRDLFGQPVLNRKSGDGSGGDAPADATGPDAADGDASGDGAAEASVAVDTASPAPSVEPVEQAWPEFVQSVKRERIRIGSFLSDAKPVERTDGTLTLSVPDALCRDTLRSTKALLVEHLDALLDGPVDRLRFTVREPETTDEAATDAAPLDPRERLERLRKSYDALDLLFTEFGAEMAW